MGIYSLTCVINKVYTKLFKTSALLGRKLGDINSIRYSLNISYFHIFNNFELNKHAEKAKSISMTFLSSMSLFSSQQFL